MSPSIKESPTAIIKYAFLNPSTLKKSDNRPMSFFNPGTDYILHDCVPIQESKTKGILPWIKNIYRQSRGFEICTFNSSILSSVLKKQSANWPSLAQGYICDVISTVHIFIRKASTVSCRDQKLGENILSLVLDDLIDKSRHALSTTNFLLQIEREGTPMTQNHYLNSNLKKWSELMPIINLK